MSAEEYFSEDNFSESENEEMKGYINPWDTTDSYSSSDCDMSEIEFEGMDDELNYNLDNLCRSKTVSQIPSKTLTMERFYKRFPQIGKAIFSSLDDHTLSNCKEASEEMQEILENEKYIWVRKLQVFNGHFEKFKKSWIEAINKTPVERVRKLTFSVQKFMRKYRCYSDFEKQLAPLHIVAALGDFHLFKYILGKTTKKNPRGSKGLITQGSLGAPNYPWGFLVMDRKKNSSFGHCRATPLHLAAVNGHSKICKMMMQCIDDKNPQTESKSKITVLHIAATNNHFDVFKLIMENVKDKNPQDQYGKTPLHIAANKGHYEICELLTQNVQDKSPRTFLDSYRRGANTPLHEAAWHGRYKIVKLLLDNVENKIPTNTAGETPLHLVAAMGNWGAPGHLKTCRIIMDKMSNRNPRDNSGKTPMHRAVESGYFAMCKLIIENIEDKNPKDNGGDTPLHKAAELGYFKIAKLICQNVRDLEPENDDGFTPEDNTGPSTITHVRPGYGSTTEHKEGHWKKLKTLKSSLFA